MRTTSILLLLLYLSAVCRPAFPLVADGMAHLFWHQHHLETKHAHLGQAHLVHEVAAIEMGDLNHKSSPASPKNTSRSSDFLFVHLPTALPKHPVAFLNCRASIGKFLLLPIAQSFPEVKSPPPDLVG